MAKALKKLAVVEEKVIRNFFFFDYEKVLLDVLLAVLYGVMTRA